VTPEANVLAQHRMERAAAADGARLKTSSAVSPATSRPGSSGLVTPPDLLVSTPSALE